MGKFMDGKCRLDGSNMSFEYLTAWKLNFYEIQRLEKLSLLFDWKRAAMFDVNISQEKSTILCKLIVYVFKK